VFFFFFFFCVNSRRDKYAPWTPEKKKERKRKRGGKSERLMCRRDRDDKSGARGDAPAGGPTFATLFFPLLLRDDRRNIFDSQTRQDTSDLIWTAKKFGLFFV